MDSAVESGTGTSSRPLDGVPQILLVVILRAAFVFWELSRTRDLIWETPGEGLLYWNGGTRGFNKDEVAEKRLPSRDVRH